MGIGRAWRSLSLRKRSVLYVQTKPVFEAFPNWRRDFLIVDSLISSKHKSAYTIDSSQLKENNSNSTAFNITIQ